MEAAAQEATTVLRQLPLLLILEAEEEVEQVQVETVQVKPAGLV